MQIFKNIIKFLLSKILGLSFLERLTQNIIHRKIIRIKKPKIVSNINGSLKSLSADLWNDLLRHKVWEKIPEYVSSNSDIIYLEFGVWEGHSINYFAKKYKSKDSEFYGFDTFHGFPENCLDMSKGHYSTDGAIPETDDIRIKFIKGLFQKSLNDFIKNLKPESRKKTVIIHFDAPLYSATLYNLFKLDEKFKNYYFIFDQFGTAECRAINDFSKSTMQDYDLYLTSILNYAPEVVFGKFKN